jgi:hypothetical protein
MALVGPLLGGAVQLSGLEGTRILLALMRPLCGGEVQRSEL